MNSLFENLDCKNDNENPKFLYLDFLEKLPLFEFSGIFGLAKNFANFPVGSIQHLVIFENFLRSSGV